MATFTALNGGSPKASEGVNGSSVPARRNGSEERQSNTPAATTTTTVSTTAAAPEAGSPTGKVSTPAENASVPAVVLTRHEREHENQQLSETEHRRGNGWIGALSNLEERPPLYRPTAYPDSQGSSLAKRKRSHSPPISPPSPTDGSRGLFGRRGGSEPRDTPHVAPRDRSSLSPPKLGHDTDLRRALGRESARDFERSGSRLKFTMMSTKEDNWGPNYEQLHSAVPDSAVSEVDPISELVHFEGAQAADVDMDDSPVASYRHTSFVPEQRRDGVIQSDPKKRKRNFSNRTKTGCLTCRRRKKKCDEAKPECSNCIKGGFVCAGYPPQRGAWPSKQESKVTAVQIESKDPNYRPPGAYGMGGSREPYAAQCQGQSQSQPRSRSPGQTQSQNQRQSQSQSPSPSPSPSQSQDQRQPSLVPQAKREPLPAYRGQALRIQTPTQRLITEEGRPMNSLNSPTAIDGKVPSRLPPGVTQAMGQSMLMTPDTAGTPTKSKEFPPARVPPLHDLSRKVPEPTSAPQQPQHGLGQTGRTSPPLGSVTSGAQATAQMALSHSYAPSSRVRREKDQMLGGFPFYPHDKELVLERERCSTSVWRFNNATNPGNGVSPTERSRLFREILQPSEGVQLSQAQVSPVTHTGQLGAGVVVEAPFHADYGYNIKISDNVALGRNCSIHDAGEVTIGANTVISPNVCIYTMEVPLDPRQRNGARGEQSARPVHIEEDVFIGANAIILPGVRIGAGSTVGAGSLVAKDLPPRSVCYGQPAKVRGSLP